MITTITSFKGGQAKTTKRPVGCYSSRATPHPTHRWGSQSDATSWNRRKGFSFKVVDEKQGFRLSREFEHIVIK
jgi:hypothetical protein